MESSVPYNLALPGQLEGVIQPGGDSASTDGALFASILADAGMGSAPSTSTSTITLGQGTGFDDPDALASAINAVQAGGEIPAELRNLLQHLGVDLDAFLEEIDAQTGKGTRVGLEPPTGELTSGRGTVQSQESTAGRETVQSQESTAGRETVQSQESTAGRETVQSQESTAGRETVQSQEPTPVREVVAARESTVALPRSNGPLETETSDLEPSTSGPVAKPQPSADAENGQPNDPTDARTPVLQTSERTANTVLTGHNRVAQESSSPVGPGISGEEAPGVGSQNRTMVVSDIAKVSSTETSRPMIVTPGTETLTVRPGDGQSIHALDLESMGVRHVEVRAETDPRPSPTSPAIGRNANAVRPAPAEQPLPVETAFPDAKPSASEPDQATLAESLVQDRPERFLRSGIEGRVTSRPEWRDLRTGRIAGRESIFASTDAAHSSAEVVKATPELGFEMDGSHRHANNPRAELSANPVKPLTPQVFSLEPARRVTMFFGDKENQVQVQVREAHGEVSVRINAPTHLRGGLEASVQNLVDSLSREHVNLSDLAFSDPSDKGPDAGDDSRNRDSSKSSGNNLDTNHDAEDTEPTTEFETSVIGSRIRLTA